MWMFLRKMGLGFFAGPITVLLYFTVMSDFKHINRVHKQREIHNSLDVPSQHDKSNKGGMPSTSTTSSKKSLLKKGATRAAAEKKSTKTTAERQLQQQQQRPSASASSAVIQKPITRPSLESMIDGEIKSDVQWLLDFSIVGFGKCGTSTIMEWLDKHPDLQCIQEEVWSLTYGKPKGLVSRLYNDLPPDLPNHKYKRGYKCPGDIADLRVINYYRKYWPRTKLFVGIRHPVLWFQSLYNFRVQNLNSLPDADKLVGRCMAGMKNTCTDKGNFGYDLMRLGKTNAVTPNSDTYQPRLHTSLENEILGHFKRNWYNATQLRPVPNDVFIFDIGQLQDPDHELQFRKDVQQFLNLDSELPPLVHNKPGKKYTNATLQAMKDQRKINICDDRYDRLRKELMRLATTNSEWIRTTFLNLPGIYSSKSISFMLEKWMHDPCDDNNNNNNNEEKKKAIITSNTTTATASENADPNSNKVVKKDATTKFSSDTNTSIAAAGLLPAHPNDVVANTERERWLKLEKLYPRPPLNNILDPHNGTITGDVSWLLDFSIIGFGKCGTSTLMEWLDKHPDLQCIQEEVWALVFGRPKGLIKRLYNDLPPGPYKRGYKCPADVADLRVLNYYRRYFPHTKLFVGLRHPVSWFQSLYNFRTQNLDYLPHPNKMIGPCMGFHKNTCTAKGNFGFDLMRMGKKNWNGPAPMSDLENQILGRHKRSWYNSSNLPPLRNDLFIFDIAQLGDKNETRIESFRDDVRKYLGLDMPLPDMVHNKPGKTYNATVQAIKDAKKINICEEEYLPVRTELMRLARLNSQWMREVFLNLPTVYSSRAHLEELLLGWMDDPCEKEGVTSIK